MVTRGDRVEELYRAGRSIDEIVNELGCSPGYIHKIRRNRGIPPQHPRGADLEDVKQEVARRYSQGETADDISASMSIAKSSVYRALKKARVTPRRQVTPPELLAVAADEIVAKYDDGRSLESIAKDYGCTGGAVRNVLRRNGVERRSPARKPVVFTASEQKVIIELRDAGGRVADIAEQFGRDPSVVTRFLREVGRGGKARRPRVLGAGGYVFVRDERGDLVLEHRQVMSRALGRPLTRTETVHHLDGDITNNRLENLQLRHGQHGKGVALRCMDCGSHNVQPVELG